MRGITSIEAFEPINCRQCRHIAVSWDPRMPYSCLLMGFKSKNLPAIDVLRSDGRPCVGYVARPHNQPQNSSNMGFKNVGTVVA